MKLDVLHALNAERAARRAAVLVTDVASGEQRLVKAGEVAKDPLKEILDKRLRMAKSGMEETPQGRFFLTVYVPSPRLVITGAVHISQTLAPIGQLLGYDVTIVDPRTAFASIERFPDVKVIAEWPDVALPPLGIDHYTAFVALTHDPKIDDPALKHALARDCFYIGALGSRKTHTRRVERLKQAGLSDADIARIHAPIGLDIEAVSPAEIAVAIMLGKIIPYIIVGFVQAAMIIGIGVLLFGVPILGNLFVLAGLSALFIATNLSIGYTFSTVAQNQLQAMQMSIMFFLPNILLSGFLFPFAGMPTWAQWVGEALPLTHYLRIVRAVMLKGSSLSDLHYDAAAMFVLMLIAMTIAVTRFRRTLD